MPTSAVELCNQALSAVPARRIVSLQDNTRSARECRTHYDQAMEETIERGRFNFQTKRMKLVRRGAPIRGWTRAFLLPDDLGFPLRLSSSEEVMFNDQRILFDWEGSSLYASAEEVWLEYVSNDPQYAVMTASFRKAFIDTLAARLVVPLSGDQRREQALTQRAEVFNDRAAAASLNSNSTMNTYGNDLPECLRNIGSL